MDAPETPPAAAPPDPACLRHTAGRNVELLIGPEGEIQIRVGIVKGRLRVLLEAPRDIPIVVNALDELQE